MTAEDAADLVMEIQKAIGHVVATKISVDALRVVLFWQCCSASAADRVPSRSRHRSAAPEQRKQPHHAPLDA